jgi:hypothetical protein
VYRIDLFKASVRCARPDFGLCKSYLVCLESDIPVVRRRHQEEAATPFAFPAEFLDDSFQELLWDIRCYLDMIKIHYSGGTWTRPPHIPLALFRNVVQHRILSIERDPSQLVRELCRVAVLLFSSVVVYPLQNLTPLQHYREALAQLLKTAQNVQDDFRLWLLFLGGMAADQTTLQSWYVSELKSLVPKYGKAWSTVRAILEGFLWLDVACGEGAMELWYRVMLDA